MLSHFLPASEYVFRILEMGFELFLSALHPMKSKILRNTLLNTMWI